MTDKDRLGDNPLGWIGAETKKTRATTPRLPAQASRGRRQAHGKTSSSETGLPEGWSRATFIIRKDHLEKLKGLSYFENKPMKTIMEEALTAYLQGKKIPKRGGR